MSSRAADLPRIGRGSGQPSRQQTGAGAGDRAVDGGQQAALALAGQGAGQFQVAPRRGVDLHDRALRHLARRIEPGHPAFLRQLDIVHQRAGRRDLRPAEIAEGVERSDPEKIEQALAAIFAIETTVGLDRQPAFPFAEQLEQVRLLDQPFRQHQFLRVEPLERRRQASRVTG